MPRFTRYEKERLKDVVIECMIAKLSDSESLDYIEARLKVRIVPRTLLRAKAAIKNDVQAQIVLLQKEEFFLEAYRRLEELRQNYKNMVKLKKRAEAVENHATKVRLLHDIENSLSELTIKMAEMLDALPFVAAVQARLRKEHEKVSEPPASVS